MRLKIIGTGSYLPEKIATNDDMAQLVETSDEWIRTRTGIGQRHLVSSSEENTTYMAVQAAKRALAASGLKAEEIDVILVATVSGDYVTPSTACMVQRELQAVNAASFDINAACAGFLFGLNTVDAYFRSGIYKTAIIIGVETLSKIVDWTDRSTCVLFGDGAGAVVAKADENGMLACLQGSDGTHADVLTCKARTNNNPYISTSKELDYVYMNGQEVFKFAVRKVPECLELLLQGTDFSPEDVDYYLLHQANYRILTSIAKKLNLPMEKFPSNVDRCGNTSAASIPILMDEMNRQGQFKEGNLLFLSGFGGGLTWGAALLKW